MLTFSTIQKQGLAAKPHRPSMGGTSRSQHPQIRHILRRPSVQTKLTIGMPNDKYEQEADRVADQVMRMTTLGDSMSDPKQISAGHHRTGNSEFVQRLAADRSPSLADSVVLAEEEVEGETVQTLRPEDQQNGKGVISKQQLNRSQGGVPLGPNVRRFMEARFGADFSGVKIHTNDHAAALSKSINARAFTYGPHIYFGNHEYEPGSQDGKRVLAHELTHVVQQGADQSRAPESQPSIEDECMTLPTGIQKLSAPGKVTRHNVAPWGTGGPTGTDHEVTTDAGSKIDGWVAYSPWQQRLRYWCHGYSTHSYVNHDYSVYSGSPFKTVVADEYTYVSPKNTKVSDLAVWTGNYDHSAIFTRPVITNGQLDPNSLLSSKDGQHALAPRTLRFLAGRYGVNGISVRRHK